MSRLKGSSTRSKGGRPTRSVIRSRPRWLRREIQGMNESRRRTLDEMRRHMDVLRRARRLRADGLQVRHSMKQIRRLAQHMNVSKRRLDDLHSRYRVVTFRGRR